MLDLSRRWGAGLYIVTEDEGATVGIREGGNVKKCRPVVKEPSGGTLLFRCALPARGTSRFGQVAHPDAVLCLGAACTGCILVGEAVIIGLALCLGAACTGCISARDDQAAEKQPLPRRCLHGVHPARWGISSRWFTLPRRCLHGVHLSPARRRVTAGALCLGAACTGCILIDFFRSSAPTALPRRCLHGVHLNTFSAEVGKLGFASALPARGASIRDFVFMHGGGLCLGAACTGCILPPCLRRMAMWSLPRRCLHGVHRYNGEPLTLDTVFASALPARGASISSLALLLPANFASALPARGASAKADKLRHTIL